MTMSNTNYFVELNNINVNEKVEKKNGLSYLSWAWAWAELKKRHPDASYKIYENADGWNYHHDQHTAWVKVGVTVNGLEHIEYLPIMDYKNKSIPLENQKKAKELLENYVSQAKLEKNAGNGIQLIPVCNYLTFENPVKIESLQDRIKPLNILYVDHQRLVLGLDSINYTFIQNDEYGIKLSFSLKSGPIMTRDIFVTAVVNKIYRSEMQGDNRICVDCRYTTIQEEDIRFIYEKATKTLFI